MLTADDYAVLSLVVDHYTRARDSSVLVLDSTHHQLRWRDGDGDYEWWVPHQQEQAPGLDELLLRDLERMSERPARLERRLHTRKPYTIVSDSGLAGYFDMAPTSGWQRDVREPHWNSFRRKLPHGAGIVQLSRPAYSRTGNRAAVYAVDGCGNECGSGDIFLLRRQNGRWQIVGESNQYVN